MRLAAVLVLALAVGGVAPNPATAAPTAKELPVDAYRISGDTPAATAAAFATDRYIRPLPAAYLVTSASFADALAVAPEAAKANGVILFVDRDVVPGPTRAALEALVPSRVIVVGGTGAVSDAVMAEAGRITSTEPRRIAGVDRYSTAAALSARFRTLPESFRGMILASGSGFADALGGAAAAAATPEVPLVLTDRDTLPAPTATEIERLAPDRVFVLGGTAAVSDGVVAAVQALGPEVVRIAGADRYATSAALATTLFGDVSEVVLATGQGFTDALVAGPLGLPLLLVPPPDAVPGVLVDAVRDLAAEVITIVGSTTAVSDAQVNVLAAARPGGG